MDDLFVNLASEAVKRQFSFLPSNFLLSDSGVAAVLRQPLVFVLEPESRTAHLVILRSNEQWRDALSSDLIRDYDRSPFDDFNLRRADVKGDALEALYGSLDQIGAAIDENGEAMIGGYPVTVSLDTWSSDDDLHSNRYSPGLHIIINARDFFAPKVISLLNEEIIALWMSKGGFRSYARNAIEVLPDPVLLIRSRRTPLRGAMQVWRNDRKVASVISTANNSGAGYIAASLAKTVRKIESSIVWDDASIGIPRVDVSAYVMDVVASLAPLAEAQKELSAIQDGLKDRDVLAEVNRRQADLNRGYASVMVAVRGLVEYGESVKNVENALRERQKIAKSIDEARTSSDKAIQLAAWDDKFAGVVRSDSLRNTANSAVLSSLTAELNELTANISAQNDYIECLVVDRKLPVV